MPVGGGGNGGGMGTGRLHTFPAQHLASCPGTGVGLKLSSTNDTNAVLVLV